MRVNERIKNELKKVNPLVFKNYKKLIGILYELVGNKVYEIPPDKITECIFSSDSIAQKNMDKIEKYVETYYDYGTYNTTLKSSGK